jgi:HEAT repeat protein
MRRPAMITTLWLALVLSGQSETQENHSAAALVEQFKSSKVFFQQFDIAGKIVALHDTSVLPGLVSYLTDEDRHARGNAAFIFAALGDDRGFKVLQGILADRSDRPDAGMGQSDDGGYDVEKQIEADRYYATHLFGDLKDPRAVFILVPLLHDQEVNYIVPWSLGEIGDKRAAKPLIEMLSDKDPSMRVLGIFALQALGAREALPRLHDLLADNERCNFDKQVSVAEAARTAIFVLETKPKSNPPLL